MKTLNLCVLTILLLSLSSSFCAILAAEQDPISRKRTHEQRDQKMEDLIQTTNSVRTTQQRDSKIKYVKTRYDTPEPALFKAISSCPELIEKILKENPELVNQEYEGLTPLYLAISRGNYVLTTYLLQHGANPNAVIRDSTSKKTFGKTVLMIETENGKTDAVKILLNYGARPYMLRVENTLDPYHSYTPLLIAIRQYSPSIIDLLIPYTNLEIEVENPNDIFNGCTALHMAVLHMQPDTVSSLLRNGANPDHKTAAATSNHLAGMTAADLANQNNFHIIAYLIQQAQIQVLQAQSQDDSNSNNMGE